MARLCLLSLCLSIVLYKRKRTILKTNKTETITSKLNVIILFLVGFPDCQFLLMLPLNAQMITSHGLNKFRRYLGKTKFSRIKYSIIVERINIRAIVPAFAMFTFKHQIRTTAKLRFDAIEIHVA